MRNTAQLNVTPSGELAEMVKAKAASGGYASESDVIRDGLEALRDRAFEAWLRDEAARSYDELRSAPSRGIPAGEIMDRVRAVKAKPP